MNLERRMAYALLELYPDDATAALEALPAESAAALLGGTPPAVAANATGRSAPHLAAAVLGHMDADRAAAVAAELPAGIAAGLLRRLDPDRRESLLAAAPARTGQALRSLLRFAEDTAGALVDPHVLALPADLEVEAALEQLRRTPEQILFNLYVVDREQRLVGVLNLRELLRADPGARLAAVARPPTQRIPSRASRAAIVAHPGWRTLHSLPVVDDAGVFLGALRETTLRRLEEEVRGADVPTGPATATALGDLFRTGVAGLLDALAAPASPGRS